MLSTLSSATCVGRLSSEKPGRVVETPNVRGSSEKSDPAEGGIVLKGQDVPGDRMGILYLVCGEG